MFGPTIGGAGGGLFGGVPPPLDMGTGPSNMGKVGDAGQYPCRLSCLRTGVADPPGSHLFTALSDADPLGVNAKVTFDSVGGLDTRQSALPHSLEPIRH